MSGPWEKYKSTATIDEEDDPWSKYSSATDDPQAGTGGFDEPQEPPTPGYFSRVGSAFKSNIDEAQQEIKKTAQEDVEKNKVGPLGALHTMGTIAGAAGKNLMAPVTEISPVKKLLGFLGQKTNSGTIPLAPLPGMTGSSRMGNPETNPDVVEEIGKLAAKYPTAARATGDVLNIAGIVPAVAGTKAVVQSGANVVQKNVPTSLENFATRNQNRQVKINSPEWNMGARPELNAKYGVIGKKAEDAAAHWESIKQPIFEALDKKIAGQLDNPDNITSLEEIRNNAKSVIQKSNADKDWKRIQIEAIDKRIGSPEDMSGLYATYNNGNIDILEAQKLKIRTGRDGAWYSTGKGAMNDADAPLKAQVSNALYDALKRNVEDKGSAGIKELNKALSEIIPMQLAAEKRMMVDKRNNFTSLDDVIGAVGSLAAAGHGNFAPMLFAGGNIAAKSPLAGRAAYGLANAIRGQKIPPGIKAIQDAIGLPEKPVSPKPTFTPGALENVPPMRIGR